MKHLQWASQSITPYVVAWNGRKFNVKTLLSRCWVLHICTSPCVNKNIMTIKTWNVKFCCVFSLLHIHIAQKPQTRKQRFSKARNKKIYSLRPILVAKVSISRWPKIVKFPNNKKINKWMNGGTNNTLTIFCVLSIFSK